MQHATLDIFIFNFIKNPLNRVRLSVEIVGKVYDGVCFQKEPSWPKDRMSAGGHSVNTAGLE
jgi:hypothetical protein